MTAHIVYTKIDPDYPATLSSKVIKEIIRDKIGFKGLLVSDCITMKALNGEMDQLATAAFVAGCDLVIYSRADLLEMERILAVSPYISKAQRATIADAYAMAGNVNIDFVALQNELADIVERYAIIGNVAHGKDPTEL